MKINELFSDVLTEDTEYEFKSQLNPDNPVKWAKTIVGFANGDGGLLFVGVSNDREAFGLDLEDVDTAKNLIAKINDRNIFPHVKLKYMLRSVDDNAERFVLVVKILPSESIVRYRDGDFNEKVFIKGDGYTAPATVEDIVALSKRKYGVDNEITSVKYDETEWSDYLDLCMEYREDHSKPSLKELQNEEIVSKDGYVKYGFLMFKDGYNGDETLLCCRLWSGRNKTGAVLDTYRVKGPLGTVFRDAVRFVERNTKTGWRKLEYGGRQEIRSYPKEAFREALVNAVAHRDYSIAGTQIDVDIYDDRIDIVSPGSWLLPKKYEDYPIGSIPSIRRNGIIAACLYVANLMERSGSGFQMMMDSYKDEPDEKQPGVLLYPGFLDLRLFDKLYKDGENTDETVDLSDKEKIVEILKRSPKTVKELQEYTSYKSRSGFLNEIINPLMNDQVIIREGNIKSPTAYIKLKDK